MYITRFVRRDSMPDEEYYYHTETEAHYHLSLFESDDSNLYEKIEIEDTNKDAIIETLVF